MLIFKIFPNYILLLVEITSTLIISYLKSQQLLAFFTKCDTLILYKIYSLIMIVVHFEILGISNSFIFSFVTYKHTKIGLRHI